MYIGLGQVDGAESVLESMPGYGTPCAMSTTGWQAGCAAGANGPDRFDFMCAEFYGSNCVAAAPAYQYPSDVWPQPQAAGVDAGVPCQVSIFGSTPCGAFQSWASAPPAENVWMAPSSSGGSPQQAPTVAPSQVLASTAAASTVPASTAAASTVPTSTAVVSTTAPASTAADSTTAVPASSSGLLSSISLGGFSSGSLLLILGLGLAAALIFSGEN